MDWFYKNKSRKMKLKVTRDTKIQNSDIQLDKHKNFYLVKEANDGEDDLRRTCGEAMPDHYEDQKE